MLPTHLHFPTEKWLINRKLAVELFLEVQIPGPNPRATDAEPLGPGPGICVKLLVSAKHVQCQADSVGSLCPRGWSWIKPLLENFTLAGHQTLRGALKGVKTRSVRALKRLFL